MLNTVWVLLMQVLGRKQKGQQRLNILKPRDNKVTTATWPTDIIKGNKITTIHSSNSAVI
jgi:hypothetical protein